MYSQRGPTLTATYGSMGGAGEATVSFNISDGRTGQVRVTKLADDSGAGVGTLSSGERCRLMYGDLAISKYGRAGF